MSKLIETHWDIEKLKAERLVKYFDLKKIAIEVEYWDMRDGTETGIIITAPEFDAEDFHFFLPCDLTDIEWWMIDNKHIYDDAIKYHPNSGYYVDTVNILENEVLVEYSRRNMEHWRYQSN